MPGPDQDSHGIGQLINEINEEYQQKYNTNSVIFNQGGTDVTVEVENTTSSYDHPRFTLSQVAKANYDDAGGNLQSYRWGKPGGATSSVGTIGYTLDRDTGNATKYSLPSSFESENPTLQQQFALPQVGTYSSDFYVSPVANDGYDRGSWGYYSETSGRVVTVEIATPWDFSTFAYYSEFDASNIISDFDFLRSFYTGRTTSTFDKMFILTGQRLHQVSTTTGHNFASGNVTLDKTRDDIRGFCLFPQVNNRGSRDNYLFVWDGINDEVVKYSWGTHGDIATLTEEQRTGLEEYYISGVNAVASHPNEEKIHVVGPGSNLVQLERKVTF